MSMGRNALQADLPASRTLVEIPGAALETDVRVAPPRFSVLPTGPVDELGRTRKNVRFGRIAGWLGSRRASTLLAFLAIFTMGPLILLSALSVNSTYSTLTQAAKVRLADASALVSVYVNATMSARADLEDSYAARRSLIAALKDGNHVNYDKPVILDALSGIRAIQSDTRFAGIVDAAGTYWGDQDPVGPASALGQNFSAKDWYQGTARTGVAYVSAAYVSADQGAPLVVAIADPVKADGRYAPAGQVVGILVVGYELNTTQRLFSDFARDRGVLVEVTDQKGTVVAGGGAVPTRLVQDTSAGVAGALKGKSSIASVSSNGQDAFAAYSPVADIGWTVVTSVLASVALADANRLRAYVVGITIVLLALLAAAKLTVYLVFRDRQAINMALTGANSGLYQKVVARTAELEASNRELEAFSYSVSHDLRSPLRAIDGFSRLMLEEERAGLSSEAARRLGLIRAGAQQMGSLIDDLLSFSRLGRVELKKRRVYTTDLVNEVMGEIKLESPERHIDFVVGDLPPCHADPVLLKQVFRNLLGNAAKFTLPRPAGRIEVGGIASTNESKGMVTYFVKDNGVGFDMRYSDKLFGVFQRLHRMEDFPGTGVGLALVRRIVERHGGKVWAESVVDAGATFYLTLEDGNART
jgi:signal transduction histidine kinase